MMLKIGDVVSIQSKKNITAKSPPDWVAPMFRYCNKRAIIRDKGKNSFGTYYHIDLDDGSFYWYESMFCINKLLNNE